MNILTHCASASEGEDVCQGQPWNGRVAFLISHPLTYFICTATIPTHQIYSSIIWRGDNGCSVEQITNHGKMATMHKEMNCATLRTRRVVKVAR